VETRIGIGKDDYVGVAVGGKKPVFPTVVAQRPTKHVASGLRATLGEDDGWGHLGPREGVLGQSPDLKNIARFPEPRPRVCGRSCAQPARWQDRCQHSIGLERLKHAFDEGVSDLRAPPARRGFLAPRGIRNNDVSGNGQSGGREYVLRGNLPSVALWQCVQEERQTRYLNRERIRVEAAQ
jgi:hypothetical protein